MYLKNNFLIFLIFFLFVFSCQPVEFVKPLDIDHSRLEKISISAKDISLNIKYNPIFSEENIEDQIKDSPLDIITNWNNENINKFGNENKFIINIIEASIFKTEIDNIDAKKLNEKTIFQYEVFFLVEYELYDDSGFLLANTTVESSRSTTSQKYISLNEREVIINDLLNNAIKDFTKETKSLLSLYMAEYIKN